MIPANAAAIVGAGVLSVLISHRSPPRSHGAVAIFSGVPSMVTSSAAGEPVVVTEARVAEEVSEAEAGAVGEGDIATAK
jgi:hypothetical protein